MLQRPGDREKGVEGGIVILAEWECLGFRGLCPRGVLGSQSLIQKFWRINILFLCKSGHLSGFRAISLFASKSGDRFNGNHFCRERAVTPIRLPDV